MKLRLLGSGEACDPYHLNTSILLDDQGRLHLLDCGFSVPHRFFHFSGEPEQLKSLWISHFHGDHFFGIPLLLLRLWEMGRTGELEIICGSPAREKVETAMDLAYPNFRPRLTYPLRFTHLQPGEVLHRNGLDYQIAPAHHSQTAFGLKLSKEGKSFYYSGDGRATPEGEALMQGCELVIHEAFTLNDSLESHGSVEACLGIARKTRCQKMVLVHLTRESRAEAAALQELLAENPVLHLGTDGEEFHL